MISRRDFSRGVALAATQVPTLSAAQSPSDRLRVGVIGCGIRGVGAHIKTLLKMKESDNVTVNAVCDVFDKRRSSRRAHGRQGLPDYREMLANRDVDVVVVATPDHWRTNGHRRGQCRQACLLRKPMTHTVEEAKRVVAKIRETGVKLQVGVQAMSDDSYETAYKHFQAGDLGKWCGQIDYSRNYDRISG